MINRFYTTIFTDIVKHNQIRKVDQLERIVKFAFDNVGRTFSLFSLHYCTNNDRFYIGNFTDFTVFFISLTFFRKMWYNNKEITGVDFACFIFLSTA